MDPKSAWLNYPSEQVSGIIFVNKNFEVSPVLLSQVLIKEGRLSSRFFSVNEHLWAISVLVYLSSILNIYIRSKETKNHYQFYSKTISTPILWPETPLNRVKAPPFSKIMAIFLKHLSDYIFLPTTRCKLLNPFWRRKQQTKNLI